MSGIRIGEAARRLGLTPRTLRYYEEMGLVAPEARSPGAFRVYAGEDIARLGRICELKNLLGFNLCEIKEILGAEDELAELRRSYFEDDADSGQRAGILARALEINSRQRQLVDAKVAALQEMRTTLDERARVYKKASRALRTGSSASAGSPTGPSAGPSSGLSAGAPV